ncbi:MAG TPA: hypothetical protein VFH31_03295 [Pyrinomonadaceae bacterium]|nr:hypothetical protein [Pyrinomonadaceae bacterium]
MNQDKGQIHLYCCGGMGVNLGTQLETYRGAVEDGFAKIEITYVDTSKSNTHRRTQIQQEHCYLMKDLDGSGGKRNENDKQISNEIRAVFQRFKPLDLNVVIHSAAGGSGSVIGPLLTGELLANQRPTIVLCVGSTDTKLYTENTLNTFKTYEAIAKLKSAPVVMAYVQNSEKTPRDEADAILKSYVTSLAALFSRENGELDSMDLFNWLRYDRVTSFPVGLVALSLLEPNSDLGDLGNITSVATLATRGSKTTLPTIPEYQCTGYIPASMADPVIAKSPMHFVTSDGIFGEVGKALQRILTDFKTSQDARIANEGLLKPQDQPSPNGLVL